MFVSETTKCVVCFWLPFKTPVCFWFPFNMTPTTEALKQGRGHFDSREARSQGAVPGPGVCLDPGTLHLLGVKKLFAPRLRQAQGSLRHVESKK